MKNNNKEQKFSDKETTLSDLKDIVKNFCDERDWDQFHNAKELAVALIIEVSELLEIFRWKTHEEVDNLFRNNKFNDIKEELADIFYFLLRISQRYNIDLSRALVEKIEKNKERYPVDKFKGSNKKYNEV